VIGHIDARHTGIHILLSLCPDLDPGNPEDCPGPGYGTIIMYHPAFSVKNREQEAPEAKNDGMDAVWTPIKAFKHRYLIIPLPSCFEYFNYLLIYDNIYTIKLYN
jgi:hypothetical protein